MICFPNAKINLSLKVGQKRPDGFHELSSIFYPIPYHDILEITESTKLRFTNSGLAIPGSPKENLCLKAYELLDREYNLPPVKMHLHKKIPMGSGMGGGSSDGSFALKTLNDLFELSINLKELEKKAAILGSDCPFFIRNEPSLVWGRGENQRPIDLSLKDYYILVVSPDIHIQTSKAFSEIRNRNQLDSPEANGAIDPFSSDLQNDFQDWAEKTHPELQKIKNKIKDLGARKVMMTGSGSSYFGIFEDSPQLGKSGLEKYILRVLKLD